MKRQDMIQTWAKWANSLPEFPPYLLKEDEQCLGQGLRCNDDWETQKQNLEYLEPGNRKFHLGLLPAPFCGNLEKASIFILMLNPGLGTGDYFSENEGPGFREVLINNLKQNEKADYFPLNPEFSWSGAFMYWHKKFRWVMEEIKKRRGCSFSEAHQILRERMASIELVPYHSVSFGAKGNFLEDLPSAILASRYVKGPLLKRAKQGDVLVIVSRKVKEWGLKGIKDKVIIYNKKGEARGAHFGPRSRGGPAIIKFLEKKGVI